MIYHLKLGSRNMRLRQRGACDCCRKHEWNGIRPTSLAAAYRLAAGWCAAIPKGIYHNYMSQHVPHYHIVHHSVSTSEGTSDEIKWRRSQQWCRVWWNRGGGKRRCEAWWEGLWDIRVTGVKKAVVWEPDLRSWNSRLLGVTYWWALEDFSLPVRRNTFHLVIR